MSRYRLEVTLDEELLEKLDKLRGHEPRASFVKRILGEYAAGMMTPQWWYPVESENLKEVAKGEIVAADPSKPVRYEKRGATNVRATGEGTPLPKIAPRRTR